MHQELEVKALRNLAEQVLMDWLAVEHQPIGEDKRR